MVGRAALNPLDYRPAVRALFRALDRWVVEDTAPPPSAYPKIADGTLTSPDRAGWPAIPGFQLPQQPLRAYHLNFGPDWDKGIVSVEPPEVGKPFGFGVPAVDADGNVRAGIRLPDIAVPLATQAGWNYRDASIGAPDRLAGEIGSYIPFAQTRAERERGERSPAVDRRAVPRARRVRRQAGGVRARPRRARLPAAGRRAGPAQTRGRALRLGDAAAGARPTNDPTFRTAPRLPRCRVAGCVRCGKRFTDDARDQGLRGAADHGKARRQGADRRHAGARERVARGTGRREPAASSTI